MKWLLHIRRYIRFTALCWALAISNFGSANAQQKDINADDTGAQIPGDLESEFVFPNQTDELVVDAGEVGDDIFFRRLTAEQEKDILDRAFPLLAAKWQFTNIFVCWETLNESQVDARSVVKAAVTETWAMVSSLEFLGWGLCSEQSQGIRIALEDKGPHVKFLGKFVDGVKNGMVLNFEYQNWGRGCQLKQDYCNRVIAVHEFGHAIGFAHEQNRPDTPGECDMQQGTDGDTISLTPWDPDSVMNYCSPVYFNNGELSEFDVLAVQHIYGGV